MAAPVLQTCPEIDKYIKYIKAVIVRRRDLDNMSEDDLRDTASSMNSELENCIDYLESLRKSNDELRKWGEELTTEIENSATYINELENKIDISTYAT